MDWIGLVCNALKSIPYQWIANDCAVGRATGRGKLPTSWGAVHYNGAVIRRFLGHERYSGQVAGQTIAHRHGVMRRYVNYFQPSFKMMEKTRNGSVVTQRYSPLATPWTG